MIDPRYRNKLDMKKFIEPFIVRFTSVLEKKHFDFQITSVEKLIKAKIYFHEKLV